MAKDGLDMKPVAWARHHVRMWQWLVFDPPMRDAASRGCQHRIVRCRSCACDLATVDDPLEGLFVGWRHRRALRRRPV